jgi:hypothetical protein
LTQQCLGLVVWKRNSICHHQILIQEKHFFKSSETIKKYEAIRAEVNGEMIKNDGKPDNDRPRIGFKP